MSYLVIEGTYLLRDDGALSGLRSPFICIEGAKITYHTQISVLPNRNPTIDFAPSLPHHSVTATVTFVQSAGLGVKRDFCKPGPVSKIPHTR